MGEKKKREGARGRVRQGGQDNEKTRRERQEMNGMER